MDRKTIIRAAFLEKLGEAPSENVPLSAMSSFGIGGPADFFFVARTEGELETAVSLAAAEKFPFYVIGGGYNLLFDDAGYRGLILRNRLEGVLREGHRLRVLSGTGLPCVLREALAAGLSGLEFLAGIPGTVGGAIYGNAGAYGWSIGDVLESAELFFPSGERRTVPREALGFGYRDLVDRLGIAAPIHYSSTREEHLATRNAVGIFDVYYQVIVQVAGKDALSLLQHACVNDISGIPTGKAIYTSMCQEDGGMIDDLTIFKLSETKFWICPTPSRVKIVCAHLEALAGDQAVGIIDLGYKFAFLSLQGPRSRSLLKALIPGSALPGKLGYFEFGFADVQDVPNFMISRTGYCGEVGFELFYPSEYAEQVWDRVFELGRPFGALPCGLGALRTLDPQ